ncbi:MAG: helix-turn-helix domain-containing protein [Thermoleophilia bacterium]
MTVTVQLTSVQLEVIAERAAQLLTARQPAPTAESPFMTIVETAAYLRARRQRVDDLLSQGVLTRVKDGSRTLIRRTEVEAYLAAGPRRRRTEGLHPVA